MTARNQVQGIDSEGISPHIPDKRSWLILSCLCLAQFINVLNFQSVTLVLPSLQRQFGFSAEHLPWVVNASVLAFGSGLLVAGRLADLFGHRRLFLSGLFICALSSLAAGLSVSPLMLLLARVTQGLSCAMMIPAALALLLDIFPPGAFRHRALGIWNSVGPIGGMAGTLLGTVLADTFGWSWIFYLNIPAALLALFLAARLLPASARVTTPAHLDLVGALLATGGLVLLITGLTQMLEPASRGFLLAFLFGGSLAAFVLFYVWEKRIARPLIPPSFFRRPSVAASNLIILTVAATANTPIFFFTLYMQQVRSLSAFLTGLAFLPVNFLLIAGSAGSPRLIQWLGQKKTILVGLALLLLAMLLFSGLSISGSYLWPLLPALLLLGCGLGITEVAVIGIGTAQAEANERGLASSLLSVGDQVGTAIGLAMLVSLASLRLTLFPKHVQPSAADTVASFQWAFYGCATFALLGLLITFLGLKRAAN